MVETVEQPWDEGITLRVRRRGTNYVWSATRRTSATRDAKVNSLRKQGYKVFIRKQKLSKTGKTYRYHIYRTTPPVKKLKKKKRR